MSPSLPPSDEPRQSPELPIRDIPGSYGIPFITPIRDRLDFYYNPRGGPDGFFRSRSLLHNSTVLRLNAPPGPFLSSDPRVIALLDARSFPVLFDPSAVDKTDALTGTYLPSLSLTGGFRVLAYLDPSHPRHAPLKRLLLNLLASRKSSFIPSFLASYTSLFDSADSTLSQTRRPVGFNDLNQSSAFNFVCEALFGVSPSATDLGDSGPKRSVKWLFLQLHPIMTLGLPKLLEELLLHTFPLPSIIARSDYRALHTYIKTAGADVLKQAEVLGLPSSEACHNLVFATVFNAYGGLKLLFPSVLRRVAEAGVALHSRLAAEIREAVREEGGKVSAAALERMELTKSVVWEVLRMDPPVKYQYGRARRELVVESHDARYVVRKGEMLLGYQPMATMDERVFQRAGEFVAERFVGEEGRRLLRYVVWSNGPETEAATEGNKQCAGKDVVVMAARLLLVVVFSRYDTFTAEVDEGRVDFTSFTKAASLHEKEA